ncbi:unnamed protein product, partial [Closterium sp. NIES-65]
ESMEDLKSRQSTTDYSPQVLPSGTPTGASSGSSSGASSGAPLRCFPQVLPSGASLRCFPQVLPSGASLTCFPQVLPSGASLRCFPQVPPSGVSLGCFRQGRVVEVWLLGAVVPSRRARGRTRMLAVLKALVAHIKAATTNASPSLQLPRAAGLGRTPHLHSGGAQGVGGMAHIKAARANGGPGGMSHLIRILGVLKALVAHIKAATANGGLGLGLGEQLPQLPSLDMDLQPQAQVSAQQAQQMERLLQQVLAEVRNGTHLTLLLRAVSTQTTILSRLAKRFSSLQSAAFSANTAAATPPPAGPDAAAGGGGATVKSLQGLVAMVLQNSQKHMSALRDVKRMLTGEEADGKGGYSVPVRTLAVVQESARALQQMPALLMQLDRRLQGVGGGAGGGVAGGGGGGGGARAEGVVVGGGGAGTGMRQQQQGQVVSAMEPPKLSGRAARHERLKQLMAKEAAARAAKQKEEEAAAAGKAAAAAAAGDTQGEGAGGQKEEGGQEQRTVEGAGQQQQEQQQGGVAAGMGAAGGAGAGGGGGDDRGGGEQGRVVLPLPLMVWREGRAGEWGERQVGMLKGRSKREERRGGSAEERGVMGKVAWMARGGELRGRLGKEMEEGRGEGLEQVEGGGKQRLEVRKERVEGNQRGEGKEGEQGEKGAQGGGGGAGGVVPIEWAKPEEMDSERADLVSMLKARRDEAGERGSEDSGVKSGGGGEAVKHRRKRKKHKGGEGRGAVGGGGKGEGEMSEEERAMAEARMAVSRERGEDEEEEEEEEGEGEGEEGEEEGEEGEEEGGEDEEKGGGKGKGEGGVKSGVGRKRRVAGGERGEAGSGELKERGGRRGGEGESKRRLGEEGRGAQGGGARGGGGNGGGGVGEGGGGEGSVARQGRRKRIPMEQAEEQQSMGAGARTGLRLKSMGIEELLSLEDEEDDEEEGAGGGGGGGAGGGTMGRMGGEGGVEVAGEGGRSSGWGEGREGQQGQGIKLGVGGRGGGVGAAARVGKAVLDDVEGEEAWTEPLPTQGYIPQGPFANASEWRQRVLAGNSVFTRFSINGYRVGPRRLVGVGVVPRAMKGRLFATHCSAWLPHTAGERCGTRGEGAQGEGAKGEGVQGEGAQRKGYIQREGAHGEGAQGGGTQVEGTQGAHRNSLPLAFKIPYSFDAYSPIPPHLHRWFGPAQLALDCTVNVSYSLGQQGSASQHTEAVIEAAFSEDVPNTGGFLAVRIEGTDFVLYSGWVTMVGVTIVGVIVVTMSGEREVVLEFHWQLEGLAYVPFTPIISSSLEFLFSSSLFFSPHPHHSSFHHFLPSPIPPSPSLALHAPPYVFPSPAPPGKPLGHSRPQVSPSPSTREAPLTFPTTTPGLPFPFHSVFCLLPSARNASVPVHLLREAVEYHRLLGAAVVALYDSGGWLAVELTERFHGDFERRVVRRTDFTGVKQFDLERNGQVLAMHDCVQRHAFTARWVIPAAINEFLFVGLPPASIPSFLDPFAYPPTSSSETALSDPLVDSAVTGAAAAVTASGGSAAAAAEAAAYVRAVPWVSVGSQWWSTRLCALPFRVPEGEAFSMERMVFRWPYPVCHDRIRFPDPHLCPGEAGFRRLIMDPRKISALGLHEAESASRVRGVHVRSTKANFNHLQDAVMDPTAWCEHTLLKNEVPEFYVRDVYLREAAQSVRAGRVCDFTRGRVSPSLPSLPARPPCSPSLLSLPALPPCSPSLLSLPALPPCSPSLPSLPALPPCSPSLRLRPWPGLKARSTPHVQRFCNCLLFLFNCCLHSLLKLKRFEGGKVAA